MVQVHYNPVVDVVTHYNPVVDVVKYLDSFSQPHVFAGLHFYFGYFIRFFFADF